MLDHKHGYGVYEWADGSEYKGSWLENNIDGEGEYTWPDGRKYKGQWKNNMPNGSG